MPDGLVTLDVLDTKLDALKESVGVWQPNHERQAETRFADVRGEQKEQREIMAEMRDFQEQLRGRLLMLAAFVALATPVLTTIASVLFGSHGGGATKPYIRLWI